MPQFAVDLHFKIFYYKLMLKIGSSDGLLWTR